MRQEPIVYVNGNPVCARPPNKIGEYAELGGVTRKYKSASKNHPRCFFSLLSKDTFRALYFFFHSLASISHFVVNKKAKKHIKKKSCITLSLHINIIKKIYHRFFYPKKIPFQKYVLNHCSLFGFFTFFCPVYFVPLHAFFSKVLFS